VADTAEKILSGNISGTTLANYLTRRKDDVGRFQNGG
jgi:hypothetical protein